MGALQAIAAKFVIDPPPADLPGRLQFLAQHLQYVEQIISALPDSPDAVDASQAIKDMTSVRDAIDKLASLNQAFSVQGVVMENVMIGLWTVASAGVGLHTPEWRAAALSQGVFTAKELDDDYMMRLGILQALMRVGQSGVLNPLFALKSGAASNGLGDPMLAIAIAAIVATAVVIIALGYCLFQWSAVTINNKKILDRFDKLCIDPKTGAPIPAVQTTCVAALKDLQNNMATQGPQNPLNTILMYAAIGGAVYLGFLFLPDIVRTFRETRSAAKGAA